VPDASRKTTANISSKNLLLPKGGRRFFELCGNVVEYICQITFVGKEGRIGLTREGFIEKACSGDWPSESRY
jgi:hypothetical protein